MNKWNNTDIYPDEGRKVLLDTNQGKYTAISKGAGNIDITESIHFKEISTPAVYVKRWRYMTDKEYKDHRGYEIVDLKCEDGPKFY